MNEIEKNNFFVFSKYTRSDLDQIRKDSNN